MKFKTALAILLWTAVLHLGWGSILSAARSDKLYQPEISEKTKGNLKEAIQKAIDDGYRGILLPEGTYRLSYSSGDTQAIVQIEGLDRPFEAVGATHPDGSPATWLIRENPCINDRSLPAVFSASNCRQISLKNVGFDCYPYYNSAGTVIENHRNTITVEVLPGHPAVDGMASCIMGKYRLEERKLVKGRLTYYSAGNWRLENIDELEQLDFLTDGRFMAAVPEEGGVTMSLKSEKISQQVEVGDTLFWFFSIHGGTQTAFSHCDKVELENLEVLGGTGFVIGLNTCGDVVAENIQLVPPGDRIALCPRDGFKLAYCYGDIRIRNVAIEGCNDDGQNVHGRFFVLKEIRNPREIVIEPIHPSRSPIKKLAKIGFFDEGAIKHFGTMDSWSMKDGKYLIRLGEPLADWITEGIAVAPYSFIPESFHIQNCSFKNIKGSGILCKSPNSLIENCHFENVMNLGVFVACTFGSIENHTMEATAPDNVEIRNCTFINCGHDLSWNQQGERAAIGTDVGKKEVASIRNVRIHNNHFRDQPHCDIYIKDAIDVDIRDNTYDGKLLAELSDEERPFAIQVKADTVENISIR